MANNALIHSDSGELTRLPDQNSERGEREVAWVDLCLRGGDRLEGMQGVQLVGDMTWSRKRDENLYSRRSKVVIRRMMSGDLQTNTASVGCVAF